MRDDRRLDAHLRSIQEEAKITVRGLGRAYGDSAQGEFVLRQTSRNHFIALDVENGIVTCEAGTSLDDIIQVALSKGWFLPTTPGTKFVTVGGAVAADVHGKNHHVDGSFAEFVQRFEVLVASGEVLVCSRDENSDLFWATIGGMGLTGIILSVEFQLIPVDSAFCDVEYTKTANYQEAMQLFDASDDQFKYSVAWIDCLSSGKALGRCVAMMANHAPREGLNSKQWARPFETGGGSRRSIPFYFPSIALNGLSVRCFNSAFYRKHKNERKLVDLDSYFYPLDAVQHWNRVYGKRGFIQYQVLLPFETSLEATGAILKRIQVSGLASFLAVLKRAGPASDGLLSFLYPGHTLALDIPFSGDNVLKLTSELDQIVLEAGGRLYLAKDALMSAETFGKMYPKLDQFLKIKQKYDPENLFTSDQARRLGIVSG